MDKDSCYQITIKRVDTDDNWLCNVIKLEHNTGPRVVWCNELRHSKNWTREDCLTFCQMAADQDRLKCL